jgi:predicted ATPase/class 3 adenylate cyclase
MRNLPTGTVTLLFTDIEGSTHLLQQLGDDYADVLAQCRRLLRVAFQMYLGHEVDTQGDAFFISFTRASDAIGAAMTAQRSLAAHPWPQGVEVCVRMGIHTGEPQLAAEGYVGIDVHLASRIMSSAHGGQVLLSQSTRELVEHDMPEGVSLRDLGEHRLKDIERPNRLFQLVIEGLPSDFPALNTLSNHLRNLPVQPTSFIGREQEVSVVCKLLRRKDVRLLTLTGTAGVGKTRLSLQAATNMAAFFPDGVYFVALASVSNAVQVVPAIAQALDVSDIGDQLLLERLKASLQEKQVLLMLDNFEQVMDAALSVADLLAVCPKLKVLVTSRAVLHVRAEHEFSVTPLASPDPRRLPDLVGLSRYAAVALFIQRAQAAKPDFRVTNENAAAVVGICARLDGLPLAIELAAARSKYFSPQALLARLDQGLAILASGARDLPARQRTLRGAISWSYDLLEVEEQKLFRRIAVFVDGCTLEACEQVCAAASELKGDVLDLLQALVDKSLLRQEEQGEQGEGRTRYGMLQTLREYGLECLEDAGETAATRDAYAACYLALAEETAPNLIGAEAARWLDRLEQEHENLRAALWWMLERAEMSTELAEQALRLCAALMNFWEIRGYFREGQSFLERALAASKKVVAAVRVEAIFGAGFLALVQGDDARAEALLEESLALFRNIGDKAGMAKSLRILGSLAGERNGYTLARALLEESLTLYRELEDQNGMAYTREDLGQLLTSQGDYARARSLLEENLLLYSALGKPYRTAYPLYHLARVFFLSRNDPAKTCAMAEESLALFQEVGNRRLIAFVQSLLGEIHLHQGEPAKAREYTEKSVATFRELEYRIGVAESLISLARVESLQGKLAAARTHYEESWRLLRERDAKELRAVCLEGLGVVAALQGAPAGAARFWGIAATTRAAIGTPMPPVYRVSYGRAVAAARSEVGEVAFAAAWTEGRTIPLEQALAATPPQELATNAHAPGGV